MNWWSVVGADDHRHPPTDVVLKPGAQRYDAHEPASFDNLMPLAESLRLLLEATPALVQAHARALGDRLLAALPPGFEPASPLEPAARSHISACGRGRRRRPPSPTSGSGRRGCCTSLRGDRIRVAPHLYSTAEDIDRLLAGARASAGPGQD